MDGSEGGDLDTALLTRIVAELSGNAVGVPVAGLSFGGTADNAFPPLWTFAPLDEAPARRTRRFLWTGPDLPQGLAGQLNGLPCLTTAEEPATGDWAAWAGLFLDGDFIVTDRVHLAALANGMLKPALFLADWEAAPRVATLPFTLACPLPAVGRVLAGFDHDAAMPDLLNWKRLTWQRLRRALHAQGAA